MDTIKRNCIPGGTYYFTQALQKKAPFELVDHIDLLQQSIQTVKYRSLFRMLAYAFLPDRLHTIWQLPDFDSDHYGRWRSINNLFSRSLVDAGVALSTDSRGAYEIWQGGYQGYALKDKRDVQRHIDFIHFSPVSCNKVSKAIDWPHSSIHRYINSGLLNREWECGHCNMSIHGHAESPVQLADRLPAGQTNAGNASTAINMFREATL